MHRVLVVDDDPAVLSCYGRLLRREGYEVETAPGGQTALARLAGESAFDVVIIDYKMPGMDGMEFLTRMRSQGQTPEVILISAWATEEVRARARCMGVRRFLDKPIDVEKLRSAIRAALPRARTTGAGL